MMPGVFSGRRVPEALENQPAWLLAMKALSSRGAQDLSTRRLNTAAMCGSRPIGPSHGRREFK